MIQSLLRALDLLEALKGPQKAFSVVELSESLDLPPSSIHRILQTLCAKDFVVKNDQTHLYQLGPALISLGTAATNQTKLQTVCQPVLAYLSECTGEDAFLMIRIGLRGLILAKAEGPNNLKVVDHFGYEQPLHVGAIRKVLLAYQSPEFLKHYLLNMEEHPSKLSIQTPEMLLKDLATIRKEGISISRSEYIQDAIGIGAPVFGSDGQMKASIGIIAPASRTIGKHFTDLKHDVMDSAEKLSYRLGYSLP